MTLNGFILYVNYFVLGYFLVINGVYLVLYLISFAEIADYVRREVFSGLSELFTSSHAPPVSVVVPAYNEEATVADSVRSFLALHYPKHEVVVVNDGSKDSTLEVLMEEFDLYDSDQPMRVQLETERIKGIYTSQSEDLIVVDKENGGKSDALNAGICVASYPLVCCMDADIILEEDALLRAARPIIESSNVAAVGGIVRVANGCKFEKGRILEVKTPRKLLPNFQIVEYLRAFITTRTAWSKLNCLLIVSGAFGMFRRRDLILAGGYAGDTVGEDMELTTRIHRVLRENDRDYRISFIPDPIAWTEVPDTAKILRRQRDRWHRGLIDTILRHRKMLFNPKYGVVGTVAMPYFFLFEFLGPVVEIVGYTAFAIGLAFGLLNLPFAVAFFVAAVGLGAFLSVAAVFLEELRLERYPNWRDLVKLTFYGILENFGYRQLNTLWRVFAIFSFLRGTQSWGEMQRKGFSGEKPDKTEDFERDPADVFSTATRKSSSRKRTDIETLERR
jgi:cellulose synthase/poly-beta-1,6-N-acetylglucosamine synthase-like glycosyltransferase